MGSLTVLSDGLTWCAAARHLHVELHGVHAQDGVTDVTEHVVARFHTHESWQLQQLLQLGLPPYGQTRLVMRRILRECILKNGQRFLNKITPFRVGEINIGPKFNDLSRSFLLWAVEETKA